MSPESERKPKYVVGKIIACLFLLGCLFAYLRLPSYAGKLEPLTDAQRQLSSRLRGHVSELSSVIGARSLTKSPGGLERAASYIEEQLSAVGLKPTRQSFSVSGYLNDGLFGASHATQSTANIVAEITGAKGKESEVIIVGAHYDAVQDCPGANDNGTGVAAMLEMAKSLAQQKCERTVRFVAFTNEEPPFFRSDDMGSYRYAKSCKERGDNIVAMFSLETLGYYSDKPDSQKFPLPALAALYPKTGNFVTFVGNIESRELISSCATRFIAETKFPTQTLAAPKELTGVDFSDQLSFWRQGYPGIMVTDTAPYRYPYYHTSQDTVDKIDFDSLARVSDGLNAVVQALAK